MINPLKRTFDSILKAILEGYVEVVHWIRKVRYPAKSSSKIPKPQIPTHDPDILHSSFRGKLETFWSDPNRVGKNAKSLDELKDAITKAQQAERDPNKTNNLERF